MRTRFPRSLEVSLQQRAPQADSRQQQQDNGTHEFQPLPAAGDMRPGDGVHTLEAYLQRARQLGDLPVARTPGDAPRGPGLRLAP